RHRRSRTEPMPDFETLEWLPDNGLQPDEITDLLLLSLEVRAAIDRLPELQRQALILYSAEDLSYAEIAQIMNPTVGTWKSRIHYAKRSLRGLLKPATLRAIETDYGESY